MKKLFLILITLLSFTNLSYGSFPVTCTIDSKSDTLQTEEIIKYHANLQKMGFDLELCKCISCRDRKKALISNSNNSLNENSINSSNTKSLYITSGVIFLISTVWFVNVMAQEYRCANNRSECKDNNIMSQLAIISLLVAISLGIAIRAYLKKSRN